MDEKQTVSRRAQIEKELDQLAVQIPVVFAELHEHVKKLREKLLWVFVDEDLNSLLKGHFDEKVLPMFERERKFDDPDFFDGLMASANFLQKHHGDLLEPKDPSTAIETLVKLYLSPLEECMPLQVISAIHASLEGFKNLKPGTRKALFKEFKKGALSALKLATMCNVRMQLTLVSKAMEKEPLMISFMDEFDRKMAQIIGEMKQQGQLLSIQSPEEAQLFYGKVFDICDHPWAKDEVQKKKVLQGFKGIINFSLGAHLAAADPQVPAPAAAAAAPANVPAPT